MHLDDNYLSVGKRIRDLRSDMPATEFAARLGVDRKSVSGWEAGKRLPDGTSLLKLMTEFGADVNFLLSGDRSGGMPSLDAAEQVLVDCYRRCAPQARQNLIQTAALLSAGLPADPSVRNPTAHVVGPMRNTGVGAVQVGSAGGKVVIKKGG